MNDQELLEWGIKESKLRKEDVAGLSSKQSLRQALVLARQRRSLVHLTARQAAGAVREVQNALARIRDRRLKKKEARRLMMKQYNEMEIEILTAIAIRMPFSLQEVAHAYDRLRSYDETINAAKKARDAMRSLSFTVDNILVRRNEP